MSDMTTSVAVAETAKWGNLIRALSRISEVAEYIYAQEQVAVERQTKLAALQEQVDDARGDLSAVENEIAAKLERAEADAKRLVEAAQAKEREAIQSAKAADEWANKQAAAAREWQESAALAQGQVEAAREELRAVLANIESAKAEALRRIGG